MLAPTPSAARLAGNSLDNLLSGIDNLGPPSAGLELVPVDGVLPKLGRGLSEGFGDYAPGLGTQGTAGGALPDLFPRFLQAGGNTKSADIGKDVHRREAQIRRNSGDFEQVNEAITDKNRNPISVPYKVDLKTGLPKGTKTQTAIPDAVSYKRGLIIDDKPLDRPLRKDRQEIIRFIEAYQQREGKLPETVAIQRYAPKTGQLVRTDLHKPGDFLP